MFGIGSTELLVILIVALVVLGPKSLPGIAKTLGKVMGEFRRVSTEFQRTMNAEVAQEEHEKLKKESEEELFGTESKKTQHATTAESISDTVDASTAKTPLLNKEEDTITAPQEDAPTASLSPVESAVAKASAEAQAHTTTTPPNESAVHEEKAK